MLALTVDDASLDETVPIAVVQERCPVGLWPYIKPPVMSLHDYHEAFRKVYATPRLSSMSL